MKISARVSIIAFLLLSNSLGLELVATQGELESAPTVAQIKLDAIPTVPLKKPLKRPARKRQKAKRLDVILNKLYTIACQKFLALKGHVDPWIDENHDICTIGSFIISLALTGMVCRKFTHTPNPTTSSDWQPPLRHRVPPAPSVEAQMASSHHYKTRLPEIKASLALSMRPVSHHVIQKGTTCWIHAATARAFCSGSPDQFKDLKSDQELRNFACAMTRPELTESIFEAKRSYTLAEIARNLEQKKYSTEHATHLTQKALETKKDMLQKIAAVHKNAELGSIEDSKFKDHLFELRRWVESVPGNLDERKKLLCPSDAAKTELYWQFLEHVTAPGLHMIELTHEEGLVGARESLEQNLQTFFATHPNESITTFLHENNSLDQELLLQFINNAQGKLEFCVRTPGHWVYLLVSKTRGDDGSSMISHQWYDSLGNSSAPQSGQKYMFSLLIQTAIQEADQAIAKGTDFTQNIADQAPIYFKIAKISQALENKFSICFDWIGRGLSLIEEQNLENLTEILKNAHVRCEMGTPILVLKTETNKEPSEEVYTKAVELIKGWVNTSDKKSSDILKNNDTGWQAFCKEHKLDVHQSGFSAPTHFDATVKGIKFDETTKSIQATLELDLSAIAQKAHKCWEMSNETERAIEPTLLFSKNIPLDV